MQNLLSQQDNPMAVATARGACDRYTYIYIYIYSRVNVRLTSCRGIIMMVMMRMMTHAPSFARQACKKTDSTKKDQCVVCFDVSCVPFSLV